MQDYLKAKQLLLKYFESIKAAHLNIENYTLRLNLLGEIYEITGNFKEAEEIYTQVLSDIKFSLGDNSTEYAESLNMQARLFQKIGNLSKAESFFSQALNIFKDKKGDEEENYANTLNNLGILYLEKKDFVKAEQFFNKSLKIIEERYGFGVLNNIYGRTLNNLVELYIENGNLKKAKQLSIESINLSKEISGKYSLDYANSLYNLGCILQKMEDSNNALKMFKNSFLIERKILGSDPYNYSRTLNKIGNIFENLNEIQKADSIYARSFQKSRRNMQKYFSFMSNEQATSFLIATLKQNNFFFSFIKRNPKSTLKDSLTNFNYFIKGALLQNNTRLSNAANSSKDSIVIDNWLSYKTLKSQISKLSQLPLDKQNNLKDIEVDTEKLEKQLMQQLPQFQEQVSKSNVRWQQVQAILKYNEASIEFVHFQYFNNHWTDSTFYAAFIVKPGLKKPDFLTVFEEKELTQILQKTNNEPDSTYLNRLYSDNRLHALIAKPIEQYLSGVNTIYLSPSGLLHKVNLAQVFGNKYTVRMLGTTGELPFKKVLTLSKSSIKNNYLFGGINYDKVNRSVVKPIEYSAGFDILATNDTRGGIDTWGYLNGTAEEISQIEKINRKEGLNNISYSNTIASEENFKNISGTTTPFTLHLATHGYFFPDVVKEKPKEFEIMKSEKKMIYKLSDDPLIRSGLILAGANKAWKSTTALSDSTEDGILTSSEISNLDLSNCQLAVLSACETALGDIKGSEGVYGLQRGFKLAGVKNIIMSLWKIPDTQSAELLTLFYNNSYAGMPIHEALKQAQATMSKKYSPYNWAGFVLLE